MDKPSGMSMGMDLGRSLFEMANDMNRAAVQHIAIGREQAFREVRAWIERNRDAHGMAHTESLLALVRKDIR